MTQRVNDIKGYGTQHVLDENSGRIRQAVLELIQKKLVIFTGKGGVGKTCVSTAFGLQAARLGKKVLLCEVRSTRRIPPLFGLDPTEDGPLNLPAKISQGSDKLQWMNFTARTALETYALKTLKLRAVYRAVFERQAVQRFLRAVPSLNEILVLGHMAHIIENSNTDLLVIDAPSSGPGLLMLSSPQAIIQSAPRGPLFDGAVWIQNLLADPKKSAINLVTIPEELPVAETIDFYHRLKNEVGLPLGITVVNRTLENVFPVNSEPVLERMERLPIGKPLAQASSLYLSRSRLQERYLDRLRATLDLPMLIMPELFDPPTGVVLRLAEAIEHLLGEHP